MSQHRFFTVDQAEKTLPLVKRIVQDIVDAFRERTEKISKRRKSGGRPKAGTAMEEKAFALEREVQQLEKNIMRFQRELAEIGVELKDYRTGLIDFYSRYEDRVVYLCWKLDEGESIRYWHDLDAGARGRKRITTENRARFLGQPEPKKV